MQFFIVILICFFIALFCIYLFAKDDLVFLRKNISLEYVFNTAFITFFVGLLTARIGFIILHPQWQIIVLLSYFPGLSLGAGIIGAMGYLFWVARKKKLPLAHICDIFALSFLLTFPFAHVLFLLLPLFLKKQPNWWEIFPICVFSIGFASSLSLFIKKQLKEGSLAAIIVLFVAITAIITDVLRNKNMALLLREDIWFIGIILVAGVILLHMQRGK